MSNRPGPRYEELTSEALRRIDAVCNRFEEDWRAGRRPIVEDYLVDTSESEQSVLLADLLVLDVEFRRQAGEVPRPEDYQHRFQLIALPLTHIFGQQPALLPDRPAPEPRRMPMTFIAAPQAHFSLETQRLLYERERALVLFILGGFTVYFIKDWISVGSEGPLDLAKDLVLLIVMGFCAVVLWGRPPLTMSQLRSLEVVIVTVLACFFAKVQWDWFDFNQTYKIAAECHNGNVVLMAGDSCVLRWFALVVGYGIFFPSTRRRCSAFVAGIVTLPLLLTVGAGLWRGNLAQYREALLEMALWLGGGAATAIYGCHKISQLRARAFEARKLGQYILKERLGTGGMGEVYLAEHVFLRRPTAVKLIRPERVNDPATLLRFEQEVQATARLTHPNTIEIYDYGRAEDGTFYYAMEYLPGLDLEHLVNSHGPLPPERVVHFLRQVCGALQEAHTKGLIHRDVKPSNLIVCERGCVPDMVKLLDFGLVRNIEPAVGRENLTAEGVLAGTPAYMSPEQCRGRDNLDARSDIYSLGAVAYFLLTGQPPFARRNGMQIIFAHIDEAVTRPSQHRQELPLDLEESVLRCLEKDPDKRFANIVDLELALTGCACAGQWTVARAMTWWRDKATGA